MSAECLQVAEASDFPPNWMLIEYLREEARAFDFSKECVKLSPDGESSGRNGRSQDSKDQMEPESSEHAHPTEEQEIHSDDGAPVCAHLSRKEV